MPIKIEQDLVSNYKHVFIYDESSPDKHSCIVVKKNPQSWKDEDQIWMATSVSIQQQRIAPDYISFMIQALEVAKDVTERLEKEYPTGEKVNKE